MGEKGLTRAGQDLTNANGFRHLFSVSDRTHAVSCETLKPVISLPFWYMIIRMGRTLNKKRRKGKPAASSKRNAAPKGRQKSRYYFGGIASFKLPALSVFAEFGG